MDSKQAIIFLIMIIISIIIFICNPIVGFCAIIISCITGRIFNIITAIRRNDVNKQIYKNMKK